jgi:hypothetical protein
MSMDAQVAFETKLKALVAEYGPKLHDETEAWIVMHTLAAQHLKPVREGEGRFQIEEVEDDPGYWHVIDTKTDEVLEMYGNKAEAQDHAEALNDEDLHECPRCHTMIPKDGCSCTTFD